MRKGWDDMCVFLRRWENKKIKLLNILLTTKQAGVEMKNGRPKKKAISIISKKCGQKLISWLKWSTPSLGCSFVSRLSKGRSRVFPWFPIPLLLPLLLSLFVIPHYKMTHLWFSCQPLKKGDIFAFLKKAFSPIRPSLVNFVVHSLSMYILANRSRTGVFCKNASSTHKLHKRAWLHSSSTTFLVLFSNWVCTNEIKRSFSPLFFVFFRSFFALFSCPVLFLCLVCSLIHLFWSFSREMIGQACERTYLYSPSQFSRLRLRKKFPTRICLNSRTER